MVDVRWITIMKESDIRKVLDSASNTAALDTVHVGRGNDAGEERVLREAFEALQEG
jgi:predicted metal-dependent hydrolase